jgi:HK97 family phage major capsid protein
MPANGLSGMPYGTLFGRPVIPVEYRETLGTKGDIILADFGQYVIADKGGVTSAVSIHVRFIYDEQCFRFTYRVSGQSFWNTPLSPYRGTNTISPFVVLETRV